MNFQNQFSIFAFAANGRKSKAISMGEMKNYDFEPKNKISEVTALQSSKLNSQEASSALESGGFH